jgi:hypothetical protein
MPVSLSHLHRCICIARLALNIGLNAGSNAGQNTLMVNSPAEAFLGEERLYALYMEKI